MPPSTSHYNKLKWLASLIAVIVCGNTCFLSSCSDKKQTQSVTTVKQDGQKVVEAYEKGDWETIVSICDTLVDEKDSKNLMIPYAEALAAVGKPQKAIYLLDKKIESNPNEYFLYQTKGNVYYSMERFDSAIICYEKVISMRPTYARAYMNVGETYELIGNKDKAITNYLEAAKLFVENDYMEEAVKYTSRVLSLDSTNVEAKELLKQIQSIK
jgi:tetratricopeptide (TPR) repeat protein